MQTVHLILIISLALAVIGLIIELSSALRERKTITDQGGRPVMMHRNLRLMGKFIFRNGQIFYHCFCLGPFPIFPIGCYNSKSNKAADIVSKQRGNFIEVLALYFRWGWLVAVISLLLMVL